MASCALGCCVSTSTFRVRGLFVAVSLRAVVLLPGALSWGCSDENAPLFEQPAMPSPEPETVTQPARPALPALVPTAPAVVPVAEPSVPAPSAAPPVTPAAPLPLPAPAPAAAAAAPRACQAFGAFAGVEPINGLGLDVDSFGPVFAADGRTLFFSAVAGDENIFSAARKIETAQFGPATPVPNLDDGGSDEGTPFLSFDGLSLYFFSTRPGPGVQGGRDIWVARRPSAEAPFAEPRVLPAVNGPGLDHLPRLSRDELSILFVSGRESPNQASNIWMARRGNLTEDFAAAVEVPGINTNSREEGFSLSPDGLTLFLASNRLFETDMDLFVATRSDLAASFETPEPLVDLNSPADDLDPQLSPDGRELFFASSRGGTFQLFRSVRECLRL